MDENFNIKEKLFDIITPDISYLLGLIWADGHVGKNDVRITSKDIDFLKMIPTHFNIKCPVYIRKDSNAGDLVIASRKFKNILLNYGLHNKKSNYGVPILENVCFSHFLRGVFDGDGCINIVNSQLRIFIATNKDAGELFKAKILELLNIDITLIERYSTKKIKINDRILVNNNICRILQTKNIKDADKLMNYLYTDCGNLYLERKKETYERWKIIYEEYQSIVCNGCGLKTRRVNRNQNYCEKCRLIKRKCQNRRQDHCSRKSTASKFLNDYRNIDEIHCNLERN